MKKGLVISDSGPIFSLAILGKLLLLDKIFDEIHIPTAVWVEISKDKSTPYYEQIEVYFRDKIREISGTNQLMFVMDYGESESVILYNEMDADYLLIDDKKARNIAESFGINCIGTIGVLSIAKDRGLIIELRPLFEKLIQNKRYYSKKLLNAILERFNEGEI